MCQKLILLVALAISTSVLPAAGQLTFKTTAVQRDGSPVFGRDMWFALPKNYEDQPGKYFQLYVSSSKNTIVHVESLQGKKDLVVQPWRVASFSIPLGWEMKSSSVVENKGIRVYSDDADIECYVMSHNPYGSDGFYVIPTIGLGRDYVVAAYGAFFSTGALMYDYPSEFVVVANHDSTVIRVTPTQDVRGNDSSKSVLHPGKQPFTEALMRGQSVQYQLVPAQDADNYDVTGSRVTSNFPVGVIGASTCPNIPSDFPYCDHVNDMIPPIRNWGKLYYTANFFQIDQGHDASTILVIGSHDGQIIYRFDARTGLHAHCILDKAFDHNFQPDVSESSRFSSDYPFLLVQYINSSTYPDGSNGQGDPAMVVIPAADNFQKRVIYQTPPAAGNQSPYVNYVNVIVNAKSHTTFDGKNIKQFTRQTVDGIYDIYRIHVDSGLNQIISDSGVGVYCYGYGSGESYAWAGALPLLPVDRTDSIPPVITPGLSGLCIHALIADSMSGVAYLQLDSSSNVSLTSDSSFIPGDSTRQTFGNLCVIDSALPAQGQLNAYDMAGNHTMLALQFLPSPITGFVVLTRGFSRTLVGTTQTIPAVTIYDTSAVPIVVDSIWTTSTDFQFKTSLAENLLPDTIASHGSHSFSLTFAPLAEGSAFALVHIRLKHIGTEIVYINGDGIQPATVFDPSANNRLAEWLATGKGQLELGQVSPNPTDGSATVRFALRSSCEVGATVYSVLGEEMFLTKLGEYSEGIHEVPINFTSLLAGTYILRLTARGEVHSTKVIVR